MAVIRSWARMSRPGRSRPLANYMQQFMADKHAQDAAFNHVFGGAVINMDRKARPTNGSRKAEPSATARDVTEHRRRTILDGSMLLGPNTGTLPPLTAPSGVCLRHLLDWACCYSATAGPGAPIPAGGPSADDIKTRQQLRRLTGTRDVIFALYSNPMVLRLKVSAPPDMNHRI